MVSQPPARSAARGDREESVAGQHESEAFFEQRSSRQWNVSPELENVGRAPPKGTECAPTTSASSVRFRWFVVRLKSGPGGHRAPKLEHRESE
jgi:hypothetical protein